MSLYIEASRFLLPPTPFQSSSTHPSPPTAKDTTPKSAEEVENDAGGSGGLSLASRIFSQKNNLRSSPGHIFKVVIETRKWDTVLARVIESSEVLEKERKLTPELALLLTHDLLLTPNGIAAPKSHALVAAITRHKARLSSEFTRARVKAGYASLEAWKNSNLSNRNNGTEFPRPRWARVNTLKVSRGQVLSDPVLSGYTQVPSLSDLQSQKNVYCIDKTIPNLLAFPSSLDLTKTQLYKKGHLILQDKASCIPAYLLNHSRHDRDIIDACAAPGNKTSHLASVIAFHRTTDQKLYACERDASRSKTLRKMLDTAGAEDVTVLPSTDFLNLNPIDNRFKTVTSILLDPSCSGSGMLGRDEDVNVTLPRRKSEISNSVNTPHRKGKPSKPQHSATNDTSNTFVNTDKQKDKDKPRLRNLSNLQVRLIEHAFSFQSTTRVAYSTCSIHPEENELVVLRTLQSEIARKRGWRILKREEQVDGLQSWKHRGLLDLDLDSIDREYSELVQRYSKEIREACIRCHKGDAEGTMGFFAVCFVRDDTATAASTTSNIEDGSYRNGDCSGGSIEKEQEEDAAKEWQGFSSDDES